MSAETPTMPPERSPLGLLALAGAVLFATAVTAFLFLTGGNDAPAESVLSVQSLPGAPTPYPNTGVLDPQRPKVDGPAPDFALVDARDGKTVRKLSDFRGKAVVVNWYASWCGPCRAEIPEFQAAQTALESEVVFLGVDYLEGREKATGILKDLGGAYLAVLDNNGAVAEHYRVQNMPSTFFIDRDGIIRVIKTGQVTQDELVKDLAAAGVSYRP